MSKKKEINNNDILYINKNSGQGYNEFNRLIKEVAEVLIRTENDKSNTKMFDGKYGEFFYDKIYESQLKKIVEYCKECLLEEIEKQSNHHNKQDAFIETTINNYSYTTGVGGSGYGGNGGAGYISTSLSEYSRIRYENGIIYETR